MSSFQRVKLKVMTTLPFSVIACINAIAGGLCTFIPAGERIDFQALLHNSYKATDSSLYCTEIKLLERHCNESHWNHCMLLKPKRYD